MPIIVLEKINLSFCVFLFKKSSNFAEIKDLFDIRSLSRRIKQQKTKPYDKV